MLWKGKLSVFKVDNYLGHWRKLYWALCYRWQWGNLSVERFSPHPFQRLLPLMLRIASFIFKLLLKTDNCKLTTISCLRQFFQQLAIRLSQPHSHSR